MSRQLRTDEHVVDACSSSGASRSLLIKQYTNSVNTYSTAIELNPSNPFLYLNRSTTRAEMIDFISSIDNSYQRITIDSDPANRLNNNSKRTYSYDEAIADLNKAVKLYPDFAYAYYNRANLLALSGSLPEAFEDYSKAIELNPAFAEAYYNRGIIQIFMKDTRKGLPRHLEGRRTGHHRSLRGAEALRTARKTNSKQYTMAATIQRKLNDSAAARWTALVAHRPDDVLRLHVRGRDVAAQSRSSSRQRGWDSRDVSARTPSSEYFLNVFVLLPDLRGHHPRQDGHPLHGTALGLAHGARCRRSSSWASPTGSQTTEFCAWLNSWWVAFPGSAKMASLGFMIFGCGCEMAGTTVSKSIAKWFEGKEMALAMGLEMAIARLGVFAVMWLAPMISKQFDQSIVAPVAFCTVLLIIGLLCFTVFVFMDGKLDRQLIAAGELKEEKSSDEEFHIRDLGAIFRSKMFWLVALLCVLYYSAIFPFQRYAPNFLESDARHRRRIGRPALQLLPDPGHDPHALPRCTARLQGQGGHDAHGRRRHHDLLPPELRLPAAALPVEVAGAAAGRDARRVVLARPGGAVALGAEDHRLEDISARPTALIFWIQNIGLFACARCSSAWCSTPRAAIPCR